MNNVLDKMENKKGLLIVGILLLLFLFVGGTFAYWGWTTDDSQRTNIVFTIPDVCMVSVDGGGEFNSSLVNVMPATCTNTNNAIVREVNVNVDFTTSDSVTTVNLWLYKDDLTGGNGNYLNTDNFRYALTTSPTNCTSNVVASGSFNGYDIDERIQLFRKAYEYDGEINISETYYLYIWLDAAETDISTAGKSFKIVMNATCSNYEEVVTLDFDMNGGTGSFIPTTVGYGETITLPEDIPSYGARQFLGWSTSSDTGVVEYQPGDTITLTRSTTLFAVYMGSVTLSYDMNGGVGAIESTTVNYGDSVSISSTVPTKTNYTFKEWNTKADGTGTSYHSGDTIAITIDTMLYAIYRINVVTVKYHVNGGSIATTSNVNGTWTVNNSLVYRNDSLYTTKINYGATIGTEGLTNYNNSSYVNISRNGYTTVTDNEWICHSGCTTENKVFSHTTNTYTSNDFCNAANGDCEVVLKVNWTLIIYTVTYNMNGGSGTINSQTKTHDAALTLSTSKPTMTGYTFKEWNTKADGTGISYSSGGSYTTNANVTLYAIYTINTVNINFHVNGGSIATTSNVNGTWTVNNSLVYRNDSLYTTKINYGASLGTDGLTNYNNSSYVNISRNGYAAVSGAEWICSSGCTVANKTFNQNTVYTAADFCNAVNGDCTVILNVNWTISTLNLFSANNQYTDVTGGWTNSGFDCYGGTNSKNTSVGETLIARLNNASSGQSVIGTANAIDLTNYSTLYFTGDVHGGAIIGISSTKTSACSGNYRLVHNSSWGDLNGTKSIDISGATGMYYVYFSSNGSQTITNPYISISEVWLAP